MTQDILREDTLNYHKLPQPGKLGVHASKPCLTQRDLSLAYTPGVAIPCLEIKDNPDLVDEYTTRSNLVGVITNGSAVLGLGNIGPLASKPVMEGKAVLFKRFADIDVFDIEITESDPEAFVETVARMEPTFGGINLEDIKAPECFYIEKELRKRVNVPVLHDDQHGTAVITSAALINALYLQEKEINKVLIVCNGAGAAGFACMKLIESMGAKKENILFLDRKGVIHAGRKDLPEHKQYFATERPERTLEEAMQGADVFVGLSEGNIVSPEMLKSMGKRPIVFAMANPDPEIAYDLAMQTREDLIMATGRSDHPNQINNVLGFPYLFRGALDVRATTFNEEMLRAAANTLAALARQGVPDVVLQAYGGKNRINFGPDYIIPKPFDPRLIEWVPAAVAKAAIETGVARKPIEDLTSYSHDLAGRIDISRSFMRWITDKAKNHPLLMVLPEGEDTTVIRAANIMHEQGIARPVLLGSPDRIQELARDLHLDIEGIGIIDPEVDDERFNNLVDVYYSDRQRRGILRHNAIQDLRHDYNVFGAMLVKAGLADGLLSGRTAHYPNVLRPVLKVLGHDESGRHHHVYGLYMLVMDQGAYLLSDTTVNVEMNPEQLAELAWLSAETAKSLGFEPRVAMLSFSNFGSVDHPETRKVAEATRLVHRRYPSLIADGEMQADTAVNSETLGQYPFSLLKQPANVLIFPTMQTGNIAYKLIRDLGKGTAIGPILLGLPKQVHVLQTGASVDDIVNIAAIAAARAAE
ncbi:MAG: NADP-dependent malic enzyme [Mariprofundaceae bacterium]